MKQAFYSNGKLLLTGEYLVLDGALSLAVPTSFGQVLEATATATRQLQWKSFDADGALWFEAAFDIAAFGETGGSFRPELRDQGNKGIAARIVQILTAVKHLNPHFLKDSGGCLVENTLTFPRGWGLGSSSTLINNIAQWAGVDPFELLWRTFDGSGYDIACARHDNPLLYQLANKNPKIKEVNFDPPFKNQLYFVYLNKKQDSREAIRAYRRKQMDHGPLADQVSNISREIVDCSGLMDFDALIQRHEELVSTMLKIPTIKSSHFPDFGGAVKSLGAWGGDFILAAGGRNTPDYFREKGYTTVIPYSKMVLRK